MNSGKSMVTIHMASSLDGFIAKKDGSVDWLHSKDNYEKGVTLTDEEIGEFLKNIDCYVMGSRTFVQALELGWPYGDKPVYVLSRRDLRSENKNVTFYSGDLAKLINEDLKPRYQNIWMAGGAKLTKDFLRLGLADKIVITITPVILGDGVLFFDYIGRELLLHLEDVTAYKDAMVELTYEIKK